MRFFDRIYRIDRIKKSVECAAVKYLCKFTKAIEIRWRFPNFPGLKIGTHMEIKDEVSFSVSR